MLTFLILIPMTTVRVLVPSRQALLLSSTAERHVWCVGNKLNTYLLAYLACQDWAYNPIRIGCV